MAFTGTIQTLLQSPLARLAYGLGLFYGVVKFFDTVGEKLNDDTRLEVAVWLLDLKTARKVETWPATFAKVFDRVFGERHLSWKCFRRSCLATLIVSLTAIAVVALHAEAIPPTPTNWVGQLLFANLPVIYIELGCAILIASLVPDYLSLLETRFTLHVMQRSSHSIVWILALLGDFLVTIYLAGIVSMVVMQFAGVWVYGMNEDLKGVASLLNPMRTFDLLRAAGKAEVWFIVFPAFFTSIWLWLYAGAGFILKGAGRFDVLVGWMNRRMDIEKKPLQSIGLVAGGIVALVYWGVVVVMRVV